LSNSIPFELSEKTYNKLLKIKNEKGLSKNTWDEFINSLISYGNENNTNAKIIENIIRKNAITYWYESWVRNFSINLTNIWNDKSAQDLIHTKNHYTSALIIGRGPSIKKFNHLKLLSESNFKGSIVCTDGSLPDVLNAGITPDKFNLFVVTIDAQENQKSLYEHPVTLQFGKGIKCILSTTAHPTVHNAAKNAGMDVFWIHTLFDHEKGKKSFNQIQGIMTRAKNSEKKIPAIQTGANVGTSAWVIAWSILGCKNIGMIGIDLGYDDDISWKNIRYHGNPIPENIDMNSSAFKKAYPTVHNPDYGCNCKQDPLFQYYCNALKEFIQKTKDKINTINATEGGALFGDGIKCITLKEFLQNYNF